MKKNILVPTDFTVESLAIVKALLANSPEGCRYNITLLHGVHLDDSIMDLLFFSRAKQISQLSNPTFDSALCDIKSKYAATFNAVRQDIFSGINQNAFNNYLEANRIDEAYVISGYAPRQAGKGSFDLVPYIMASGIKVKALEANIIRQMPEKDQAVEMFFQEMSMG